jgi:CARDB
MRSRSRLVMIIVGLMAIVIALFAAGLSGDWQASASKVFALAQNPASSSAAIAHCRYGATPTEIAQTQVISDIGAGWYLTFNNFPAPEAPENGSHFMHLVSVKGEGEFINGDPAKECESPDYYKWGDTYTISPALDASFANYIKNNPGGRYGVGNETDRVCQGQMHPELYADAYHEIYYFIKGIDPTAQIANAGLVQFSPNRRQYLDRVWNEYVKRHGSVMPVDIWTMHVYILPELMTNGTSPNNIASVALGSDWSLGKRESGGSAAQCSNSNVYCFAEHDDMDVFAEQVVAMRQWMKDHGQRNKPLAITEYSILYPEKVLNGQGQLVPFPDEEGRTWTPERVTAFMENSFDYLKTATDANLGYPMDDNKLVQQWMWFAVYTEGAGSASNLVKSDRSTLTMMGNKFKSYVASEPLFKNLKVDQVANVDVATNGAPTASARISVTFRNKGTQAITQPFTVTFYENANLTSPIGSVMINPTIYGCSAQAYTASVTWNGLTKGTHTYYVHLDSGNVIDEFPAQNGDNVGVGQVKVHASQTNLPVIRSSK